MCIRKSRIQSPIFYSENLAKNATVVFETYKTGSTPTAAGMLQAGRSAWFPYNHLDSTWDTPFVEIQLAKKCTFNVAYFNEPLQKVVYFRLQYGVFCEESKEYTFKTFYRAEQMGKMRICSFDAVTTDRVRICIDEFKYGRGFSKINDFKLFFETGCVKEDFTVAVYQRLDSDVPSDILAKIELAQNGTEQQKKEFTHFKNYANYYNTYNTVILFGVVNWDENGNLVTIDDFEKELNALKKIISMRTNKQNNVRLIVTGLADGAWGDGHKGVNKFMAIHKDKVCLQLIDFLKKHQLNGVDIDWEYPQNRADWANFNDFITKLDDALIKEIAPLFGGKKVLSGALSAGCLGMSRKVLQRFDQIQYMAYDGADKDGFQSVYHQAVTGLADFVKNGADHKKINIGIAAYGRPPKSEPFWPPWRDVTGKPEHLYWNNMHYLEAQKECNFEGAHYFVCPAHAGDKLAYALFASAGGVMVFRLACDKFPDDPNSVVAGLESAIRRFL